MHERADCSKVPLGLFRDQGIDNELPNSYTTAESGVPHTALGLLIGGLVVVSTA